MGQLLQSQESGGVCVALCLEWIRRKKLESKSGLFKNSFATAKHGPSAQPLNNSTRIPVISWLQDWLNKPPPDPFADDAFVREFDRSRMEHKFAARISPIQKSINAMKKQSLLNIEDISPQEFRVRSFEFVRKNYPQYAGLSIRPVGETQMIHWQGSVCHLLVNRSWYPSNGHEIMSSILKLIKNDRDEQANRMLDRWSPCYVLEFEGGYYGTGHPNTGDQHAGHAMAFQIAEDSREWFLDQNMGEFMFVSQQAGDMLTRFFEDLWEVYRQVLHHRYQGWSLYQYYPTGNR